MNVDMVFEQILLEEALVAVFAVKRPFSIWSVLFEHVNIVTLACPSSIPAQVTGVCFGMYLPLVLCQVG